MAINRAPFNALVDDDGSNTLGTPWNKAAIAGVILDPVDAALLAPIVAWTPIDAGGGGIVFQPGTAAWYTRTGNLISFWGQVQYPATASGAEAKIGGLPVIVGYIHSGAFISYGPDLVFHVPVGNNFMHLMNRTTRAMVLNNQLSSALIIFQGFYYAG
jgi:hypothetical protein